MTDDDLDPYEALRARIKATQDAVDRLADETSHARREAHDAYRAQAGAGAGAGPPPAAGDAQDEVSALVALVELLRDVLPPDLRAQLAELVRQLLILLRAILDWWIERIDPGGEPASAPVVVEDIEVT